MKEGFTKFLKALSPFWRYSFFALAILTAIDLILWEFFTQTMLFFAIFFLIPAWALWVWFNPHLEEEGEFKPSAKREDNKPAGLDGFKF
jgi:fatty acid desaturase